MAKATPVTAVMNPAQETAVARTLRSLIRGWGWCGVNIDRITSRIQKDIPKVEESQRYKPRLET